MPCFALPMASLVTPAALSELPLIIAPIFKGYMTEPDADPIIPIEGGRSFEVAKQRGMPFSIDDVQPLLKCGAPT